VSARRLRHQPILMLEALASLILASALIALLPFRLVARFAAGKGPGDQRAAKIAEAHLIAHAVEAWATRAPWRAVCFQQGLAVLIMLRRRHLLATLYYGAAHGVNAELVAHVWVKSDNVDVIGCDGAETYAVLAKFPDDTK
jgi:hypothetical protein